jgi:hypothetical protein
MQHAAFVRGGETGQQLPRDVERFLVREISDALEQR